MMNTRGPRLAALVAGLLATGCTTLREIPPGEYAARPQRKAIRVETREGLVYEFDYATFDADSLTGYRQRTDLEETVGQVAVLSIPLDDVQRLRSRSLDWYRTGLVGGSVIAGAIAIGLSQRSHKDNPADVPVVPPCVGCSPPARAGR